MVVLFDSILNNVNLMTHIANARPIHVISKWIVVSTKTHWNAQLSYVVKDGSRSLISWIKSSTGWFKINYDCRFIDSISNSNFITRNSNGSIIHAQSNEYHCTDALVAELFAIRDVYKPCLS